MTKPEHSPLGASSAERWMNCPGSVSLLRELKLPESDEPDYRREGTAMHQAASHCLEYIKDTWEITGETFYDTVIDAEMAQAIQVYLDCVRPTMREDDYVKHWVEFALSHPEHPMFYGTVDLGVLLKSRLDVTDLKGGVGIIVEPDDNPQLKYYAYLLIVKLEEKGGLPDEFPVKLRIVQPRAFHQGGCIREWDTTVGEIKEWVKSYLMPAMARAEFDLTLDPGPWCRFCAAKLVCPMLTSLFRAAAIYDPKEVVNLNGASIGRAYQFVQAVKFYIKALEEEAARRLNAGEDVPGTKLVPKKSNRVFVAKAAATDDEDAPEVPIEQALVARFGDAAWEERKMRSPAEIEKLGPKGKEFVKGHAYQPNTGETVALLDDPRPAVIKQSSSQAFGDAVKEALK